MFAINVSLPLNDRVVKIIDDHDELNNFSSATKLFFDEQLTLTAKRREIFEKKIRLRKIIAAITVLKARFETLEIMFDRELMMKLLNENQNVMNDVQSTLSDAVDTIAYRRRAIKSKNFFCIMTKTLKSTLIIVAIVRRRFD